MTIYFALWYFFFGSAFGVAQSIKNRRESKSLIFLRYIVALAFWPWLLTVCLFFRWTSFQETSS